MQLRSKIILLGIVPLLVCLALLAAAVRHQALALADRQHTIVQRETLRARRDELKHYLELAVSALQAVTAEHEPDGRQRALQLLQSMNYGEDGYFFAYDLQGTVLAHSRQPELVGRNLWDLRDPQGRAPIQMLIARAKAGGGFVEYEWKKPSSLQMTPKLGYVVVLQPWNWMVGTGLYLDDVKATIQQLDRDAYRNISGTMWWIAAVAASGVLLIGMAGLLLNLSEHRVSDGKLRLLARQVVQSQEDERARLSRELHDGVSQSLVSTKLFVESALSALDRRSADVEPVLGKALGRLNGSLNEVRRISHRLRPALLDTLGLPAALQHLAQEFEDAGPMAVRVAIEGPAHELPEEVKTVLFRVAQESLTNIVKHAQAAKAELGLLFVEGAGVRLRVSDDGLGFDTEAVQRDPRRGIGLRNMRERLVAVGGTWQCESSAGFGTQILAEVPGPALKKLGLG